MAARRRLHHSQVRDREPVHECPRESGVDLDGGQTPGPCNERFATAPGTWPNLEDVVAEIVVAEGPWLELVFDKPPHCGARADPQMGLVHRWRAQAKAKTANQAMAAM
jgi:hypothetical protein